jgi:tetratricopeptide (TPR) repeat protein
VSKGEQKELEKAVELSEKRRYGDAIAKLEVLQASADREIHDLALNYLADAYAATGRNADAESMLRRSIEERGSANEGLGWQLAVLAPVLRRQGKNEEAEHAYLQALSALKPDEPELRVITKRNLAYLYWTTGRQDEARNLYQEEPDDDDGFREFLTGVMQPYVEPEIPL